MSPPSRHFRGIIWDIDGTLLDSNDAHAAAFQAAFAESCYTVAFEPIRQRIGMGGDKVLAELVGVSDQSDAGKNILALKKKIFFERYYESVKPFPEVKALLETLHAREIKFAVGTSGSRDECEKFLNRIGVSELMDEKVSADDASESKPDPDIVSAALKRLHLPKSEVVMVGDTPYDIQAAARAGIACIAFRCGGWSDHALEHAFAIFDDASDFLNQIDSLEMFHHG